MKLTYLGTAAAEGAPALFCHCAHCQNARRLGGKNVRTRSQSMLDDDLLIDLSPDTYHHFLQYGIEGDRIPYLLVTHPHSDHFHAMELLFRRPPYGHEQRAPVLHVIAPEAVKQKLIDTYKKDHVPSGIDFVTLAAYEKGTLGEYRITALPARHMPEAPDAALNYIIEKGGKCVYYAHDTGYPFEDVFAFIEKEGFVFDLVSMDCTCGDMKISDESSHMGIANNRRMVERLRTIGAITPETVCVINHFSHNCDPLQERLEALVAKDGWRVSFDGCSIEI